MALYKIGITGGIGSGKSTIARMLSSVANIPVIDADQIARDVVQPDSPILKDIINQFGIHVLNADGTLNRKLLGDIVFHDVEQRIKLNNIMFPAITHEVAQQFVYHEANGAEYVIYDAPLLYTSGTDKLVDYIICVITSKEHVIDRLKKRSDLTEEEALIRISSQMPLVELMSHRHDYLISNTLSFKKLKMIISAIWKDVQNKKTKPYLYS